MRSSRAGTKLHLRPSQLRRRFNYRVMLFALVLLSSFVIVLLRMMQLQFFQHQRLLRMSIEQHHNTLNIPARRGHIYDRYGTPLAISIDVPSVSANPHQIQDANVDAVKLAKILKQDLAVIREKLLSPRYFVWLARHIEPGSQKQLEQLHLPGIDILFEPRRFYPNREAGAHVLGFAGVDAKGLEGIEKQFDHDLLGEPQHVVALRDARGAVVLQSGLDPSKRARGIDMHLAIDIQLSFAVQAALARAQQRTQALATMAIVLDVPTAQVLAMEKIPSFNPNEGRKVKAELRRNQMVTDAFEPGSILKPLVMAAALDRKIVNAKTTVFCEEGHTKIGKHVINDTAAYGRLSLTEIIAKSSNIGMAKIGALMGPKALFAALAAMGFTKRTGIELPYEAAGVLRPPQSWSALETATIAFGQGMSVTLLQVAAAYRALAAQGMWRAPTLVQNLQTTDGQMTLLPEPENQQIFSAASAKAVVHMLTAAVHWVGSTGKLAAVQGFAVAGKTGTAQKADSKIGGYSKDHYLALFAGFLPADAPRVVIVVAVDEPATSHYGGTVAAPVFAEIAAATMHRLGILPTLVATKQRTLPQSPTLLPPAPQATTAALVTNANETLPNFVGLTARQAVSRFVSSKSSLALQLSGSGRVVQQRVHAERLELKLAEAQ